MNKGCIIKRNIIIEKELLESLYLGNDYTLQELSEILKCSVPTICRRMGEYNTGRKPYEYTTQSSREYIIKNKDTLLPRGEKHHNWKGGFRKAKRDTSDSEYKHWRKSVFSTDNYTCQICKQKSTGNIEAHHIKSWKDFPTCRFDITNGITLCKDCHIWVHRLNVLDFQ